MIYKKGDGMNTKKFYFLLSVIFVMGLLPQKNVSADSGPKPAMEFEIVQEISESNLTIVSKVLYWCKQADCSDAEEVPEVGNMGPYGFDCIEQDCTALWGGSFFQFEVTFSDGRTLKSNVFAKKYFDAKYRVTITADTLDVKELKGSNGILLLFGAFIYCPAAGGILVLLSVGVAVYSVIQKDGKTALMQRLWRTMLWALIITFITTGLVLSAYTFIFTLALESILALIYLRYLKIPNMKILKGVLLANIFTQPVFVLLYTDLWEVSRLFMVTSLIILELIVWLVEAVIVHRAQERQLSFKNILVLTFFLNAASFGLGLLLPI